MLQNIFLHILPLSVQATYMQIKLNYTQKRKVEGVSICEQFDSERQPDNLTCRLESFTYQWDKCHMSILRNQ